MIRQCRKSGDHDKGEQFGVIEKKGNKKAIIVIDVFIVLLYMYIIECFEYNMPIVYCIGFFRVFSRYLLLLRSY